MQLETHWYRLDSGALPGGVVAVDATSAARLLWAGPIASVLEELVESLPPSEHPDVVFLGDRMRHPIQRVLEAMSPSADLATGFDLESQLGRYPVVGPLFRDLLDEPPRPVLLLLSGLSGPIIDLDDWAVPDVTRRVLAYRLTGSVRQTSDAFAELGSDADLKQAVDHLRDPVRSATIGGGNVLPLDWKQDGWSSRDGGLGCDRPESIEVELQLRHPSGVAPRAAITRLSGVALDLPLIRCDGPARLVPTVLTRGEWNVLDSWERNRSYYCSHCRHNHLPGQLRCEGPARSLPLFPSIDASLPAPAYVVIKRGGQWSLIPYSRGIVPLGDDRVIINRLNQFSVSHFDGSKWEWQVGENSGFIPLDDGGFAVFC